MPDRICSVLVGIMDAMATGNGNGVVYD